MIATSSFVGKAVAFKAGSARVRLGALSRRAMRPPSGPSRSLRLDGAHGRARAPEGGPGAPRQPGLKFRLGSRLRPPCGARVPPALLCVRVESMRARGWAAGATARPARRAG